MGEVWEGLDERLGRHVAVKTIRRSEADPAAARARSAREARILSRLEHPNICRLYEYVEMEECDLLVLELRARTHPPAGHRDRSSASSQRLDVALGICSALVAAHALSIVHRDLKPENVMLAEDGSVKVLDFGIARRVLLDDPPIPRPVVGPRRASPARGEGDAHHGDRWSSTTGASRRPLASTRSIPLTATGHLPRTPRYMSPEQARGEPATAASDMYSFGLVLYELYTGKPPYGTGTVAETLVRAQWGDVAPPRGIDRNGRGPDRRADDPRSPAASLGTAGARAPARHPAPAAAPPAQRPPWRSRPPGS